MDSRSRRARRRACWRFISVTMGRPGHERTALMKDEKLGRKTSPGFGDPRAVVRAQEVSLRTPVRVGALQPSSHPPAGSRVTGAPPASGAAARDARGRADGRSRGDPRAHANTAAAGFRAASRSGRKIMSTRSTRACVASRCEPRRRTSCAPSIRSSARASSAVRRRTTRWRCRIRCRVPARSRCSS